MLGVQIAGHKSRHGIALNAIINVEDYKGFVL